jgi:hypothetical protein
MFITFITLVSVVSIVADVADVARLSQVFCDLQGAMNCANTIGKGRICGNICNACIGCITCNMHMYTFIWIYVAISIVMLSKAKHRVVHRERSFAALRMTSDGSFLGHRDRCYADIRILRSLAICNAFCNDYETRDDMLALYRSLCMRGAFFRQTV